MAQTTRKTKVINPQQEQRRRPINEDDVQAMMKSLVSMDGYALIKKMADVLVAYNGGNLLPTTKQQEKLARNAAIMRSAYRMLFEQVEKTAANASQQPQPTQQLFEALTRSDATTEIKDVM
jgi:hypothetical protein